MDRRRSSFHVGPSSVSVVDVSLAEYSRRMSAPPQLIRKFQALTNRLDEALGLQRRARGKEYEVRYFDPIDALPWFHRWDSIRAELSATEPELVDIPARPVPTPSRTTDNDGRGYIERDQVERIRNDMRDAWDILNHPSRQLPQVSIDKEGIFVAGQPFDAMLAVTSILRAAVRSITIVDNYVSEHTLSVLSVKADPVTPRILTKSTPPVFVTAARAFVAQYGAGPALEVRTSTAFHDRFIVIDDVDYYHFGASIKDAGKRNAFMFSRIEEPAVLAALATTISTEWSRGTVVTL